MKKTALLIGIFCLTRLYTLMPMENEWPYKSIKPIDKTQIEQTIKQEGKIVITTAEGFPYACQGTVLELSTTLKNLLDDESSKYEVVPCSTVYDKEFKIIASLLCEVTDDGNKGLDTIPLEEKKKIVRTTAEKLSNLNLDHHALGAIVVDANYLDIKFLSTAAKALLVNKISALKEFFPSDLGRGKKITGRFNKSIAPSLFEQENIGKFISQKIIKTEQAPRSVAFYGEEFLVGLDEGTLQSYSLDTKEPSSKKNYANCDYINSIVTTPKYNSIVWGGKSKVNNQSVLHILDCKKGGKDNALRPFDSEIKIVAKSSDETLFAIGSGISVLLFGLLSKKPFFLYSGHTGQVRALAFIPGKKMLASGAEDHTIRLWNTTTQEMGKLNKGEVIKILEGHTDWLTALTCDPEGKTLISGSSNGTIIVWNLDSYEKLHVIEEQGWVKSLTVSPHNKLVYGTSNNNKGKVTVFSLKHKQEVQKIEDHKDGLYAVALSPDGNTLISTGFDNEIIVYKKHTVENLTIQDVQVLVWKFNNEVPHNIQNQVNERYEKIKQDNLEFLKELGLEK